MNTNERTKETTYKIECSKCGCYWWVKNKDKFVCPNCEVLE